MKRSVFAGIILLIICSIFFAFGASANESDDLVYYPVEGGNLVFNTKTKTIVALDETATKAIIPETIEGVTVKAVGDFAFADCRSLVVLQLPDTITTIGKNIITRCESLKTFNIPKSLTSVGANAFADSAVEGTLVVPAGVTELPYGVFGGCKYLTEVIFEGSIKVMPSDTFDRCYALEHVVFPQGLEVIKDRAFYECSSLKEIILPDTVKTIGCEVFYNNSSVETLYLGQSLVSVDDKAFYGLKSAKELVFPESLQTIGKSSFSGLGVESLTIPPIRMGDSAFAGCENLRTLVLEEGHTYIPSYCFTNATSLESLTLPHSLTEIRSSSFCNTPLTQIVIPENVTLIDYAAFRGSNNLWSVCFLGKCPTIRDKAFTVRGEGIEEYFDHPNLIFYYIPGQAGWTTYSGTAKLATWDGINLPVNPYATVYPFEDVYVNAWYADAVTYVRENGLMNGVSATRFDPDGTMNRAMLVTVLWRYEGGILQGNHLFSDVPTDQWYTYAVYWSYHNNIVNGVGNNLFAPMSPITREQVATILYRFAQYSKRDTSTRSELSSFSDAEKVSAYAVEAMQWAVGEGLINGVDGALLPQSNATRAQVATIIMRFLENVINDAY